MRRAAGVVLSMLLAGCFGDFDPDLVGLQPEDGLFSPCESSQDCSDGVCLGSAEVEVQLGDTWDGEGACTRWVTGNEPSLDCAPYPDGYATAELAYGMDASGAQFCVLECVGGLKCPVGMDCVRVYSPAVTYDSEVCL